ncbi:copper amine oxidase N-terminal domain-containing protein [Thermoanaerobacter wiegelii]|uniref:Copper amine oxidase-like domain-containing protein n=1 Tax=Thermoanaerobacter wiegelii Rt8.B1 TaxID=697303 RepID=G2MXN7_9THEO|nr:copper amine oxidase N-terminal domain-containing protein [Thermoanaerobacter wiegelii]AEM79267.1 copper amine oxidase-like domain-containing protein [Thermoanaerobacter wiegelii Rt8.B1]
MFKKILSMILVSSMTIFPVAALANDTTSILQNNYMTSYTQLSDNNTVNSTVYNQVYSQPSNDTTTTSPMDNTTITEPSSSQSSDQGTTEKINEVNNQIQKLEQELETALDKNQFEKALQISNKIKELEQKLKILNQSNNIESQIAELKIEAINYLQSGQIDEAINTITKILKLKHSKDNYKLLGKLYHQAKKDKNPHVFVNGNEIKSDVNPIIKNGRTYIPLRAVANAIGVDSKAINWDQHNQAVSIKTGNINIYMPINTTQIIVNGQKETINAPAFETNGRVMVPLRAISQLFGKNVDWYQEGQIATIGD